MRVIGIVAEYDPFHNGHEYLIRKAREVVGDPRALVLAVMSGPFTQRGVPAVLSKHTRAGQALLCGADVVIELPFTFACAPSERFAFGAVEALYRTGVVTDIAFGIDTDNFDLIKELSERDFDNDLNYQASLKNALESGLSFPSARAKAICDVFGNEDKDGLEDALRRPNSILALDYLRAVRILKKDFNIIAVPRIGDAYDSQTPVSVYPSATALRKIILENRNSQSALASSLLGLMPDKSLSAMLSDLKVSGIPDLDLYAGMILNNPALANEDTAYMGDNLAGFIANTCGKLRSGGTSFEALTDALDTRHFTRGRILRAMASAMTGQTEEFIKTHRHVPYIRVLGFTREGRYCLKIMGKCAKVPLIHNCSDHLELKDDEISEVFALDLKAGNIRNMLTGLPLNTEWDTPPVMIR